MKSELEDSMTNRDAASIGREITDFNKMFYKEDDGICCFFRAWIGV